MKKVTVDFSAPATGAIRPLHGVNSGPMTKVFTYDMRPQFKEAGFPFARLHDVEYPYGSGEFVDIPCIFRNFDADETKEENYSFGLTDEYLKACMEVGAEPLFRLGVSIEHAVVKRHVFPPKDYAKWARICEHIIRHYTEGWADGFCWNIRYWEIWNEANLSSGNNWQGTPEEFYELYCVAATHLKEKFPHLKIGGCAWSRHRDAFIEGFFQYITAKPTRIPMDFHSWHRYYADVETMVESSAAVNELLRQYGYGDVENVFDEWNYMENWMDQPESYVKLKNHIGAAQAAASLAAMQSRTNIQVACYFEADVVKEWCGFFDVDKMCIGVHGKATVKPLKPFYAFKMFNELYKMGEAVPATLEGEALYACAAKGGDRGGMLVANYGGEDTEVTLDLQGLPAGEIEVRLVDEHHTDKQILRFAAKDALTLTLPMKNNSFIYVGSVMA